jgi:hypothetical protein
LHVKVLPRSSRHTSQARSTSRCTQLQQLGQTVQRKGRVRKKHMAQSTRASYGIALKPMSHSHLGMLLPLLLL